MLIRRRLRTTSIYSVGLILPKQYIDSLESKKVRLSIYLDKIIVSPQNSKYNDSSSLSTENKNIIGLTTKSKGIILPKWLMKIWDTKDVNIEMDEENLIITKGGQ